MVRETEQLRAYGHPNVTADHATTFEITKEDNLTPAGSCIIAVSADKGAADLSRVLLGILRIPGSILKTTISWDGDPVIIRGEGSPDLTLTHHTDLVWRRSSFTCPRTIALYSDQCAVTLPRDLVEYLREGGEICCTLVAEADENAPPMGTLPAILW